MYSVYVLELNNGNLYIGYTGNIKQRIADHNRGGSTYTRKYLPVKLIYYESYAVKKDASARERYLKTGDGRQELKKQLKHYLQGLFV